MLFLRDYFQNAFIGYGRIRPQHYIMESVSVVEKRFRHVWVDPCNLLHQATKSTKHKGHGRTHSYGAVLLGSLKQATWKRGDD